MASIIYGNGVADIRGSINGTTFSRNANGAYARNKTTGTSPQTTFQVAQQARLTTLATDWRSISDAQRAAWKDGAKSFPYTNRLGIASKYTGQQLFVKLNLGRLAGGASILTSPPVPVEIGLAPFVGATATVAVGVLTVLQLAFSAAVTGAKYLVYASVNVSPGVGATSYPKVLIASVTATATVDVASEYIARFGTPAVGSKIMWEARVLMTATGQITQAAVGSVIVA